MYFDQPKQPLSTFGIMKKILIYFEHKLKNYKGP
jgi:hypothetical protein